jgi:transcriptional regulator with XRE-family HTH domain
MTVFTHIGDFIPITDDHQANVEINPMSTVGDRIREARSKRRLTQAALAKAYGCSTGMIGNLEAGIRDRPKDIMGLARALGVNAQWLDSGDGPMEGADTSPPAQGARASNGNFSYEALALASELDRIKDQRQRSIRFAQCMMLLTNQSGNLPSGGPRSEQAEKNRTKT